MAMKILNRFKFLYVYVDVHALLEEDGVQTEVEHPNIPQTFIVKVPFDLRYKSYGKVQLNEYVILHLNELKRSILREGRKLGYELEVEYDIKGVTTTDPSKLDANAVMFEGGKAMKLSDLPKMSKEEQDDLIKKVEKEFYDEIEKMYKKGFMTDKKSKKTKRK